MLKRTLDHTKLMIVDDLAPEDSAMLQALYSRSSDSAEVHLDKVRASGSGKFMNRYYVGYGHKSIADCGTTTMFIEGVSLLAAKAIQDWPLYAGQEASTRYLDMSKQRIVDPVGTPQSKAILDRWMEFYTRNQDRVAGTIRQEHPRLPDEAEDVYERAVKARTFDIMRGFLPAGITTQLSWHSNLRQAGDHLLLMTQHPSKEIREMALALRAMLGEQYPSSGLGLSLPSVGGVESKDEEAAAARATWEGYVAERCSYIDDEWPNLEISGDMCLLQSRGEAFERGGDCILEPWRQILRDRPRGCVLPHFLTDLGTFTWSFALDFGSFRDIQRHRNGVCRMPLLTTKIGFEPWYLDQLDSQLRDEAAKLVFEQSRDISNLTSDPIARQYYTALGFRVACRVTYGLPAFVYVMELRSGKMVHPTLRQATLNIADLFHQSHPTIALHVDRDPSSWDVRRGKQTIMAKPELCITGCGQPATHNGYCQRHYETV